VMFIAIAAMLSSIIVASVFVIACGGSGSNIAFSAYWQQLVV